MPGIEFGPALLRVHSPGEEKKGRSLIKSCFLIVESAGFDRLTIPWLFTTEIADLKEPVLFPGVETDVLFSMLFMSPGEDEEILSLAGMNECRACWCFCWPLRLRRAWSLASSEAESFGDGWLTRSAACCGGVCSPISRSWVVVLFLPVLGALHIVGGGAYSNCLCYCYCFGHCMQSASGPGGEGPGLQLHAW